MTALYVHRFQVLSDPSNVFEVEQCDFSGFGKAANGDVTLSFLNRGQGIDLSVPDPNAQVTLTMFATS